MKLTQKENYDPLINKFSGCRILVIGDVMLDEYVWGKVRRISPEAPVPVVEVQERTYMAGGAANTGSNVASLGGKVELIGVVGDDIHAGLLREKLLKLGIDSDNLIVDSSHPTITKTRIIANKQHVVRVDVEKRDALDSALQQRIIDTISSQVGQVDVVVISDYGKQVISHQISQATIEMASKAGIPVIVDPKGNDYSKYRGATVITPNILEAELVLHTDLNNESQIMKAGADLNELIRGEAILLTRGAEGMTLFQQDQPPITIPAVARALFDVTGAGDTVVGTLAMSLAAGSTLKEGVVLANLAAGLVVEKLGTATVTQQELKLSLSQK